MTPWIAARQPPLSMEFYRQEYWSRLPFPSAEDLPDPGIRRVSLLSPALAGRFFTTLASWEVLGCTYECRVWLDYGRKWTWRGRKADCGALFCPVRPVVSVLWRLSIGLQHGDTSWTPARSFNFSVLWFPHPEKDARVVLP